jgi:putative cell wall-binding protein
MTTTPRFAKPLTSLLGVLLAVGLVAGGAAGTAAAEEQPTPPPTAVPSPAPASDTPEAPAAAEPSADPAPDPGSDPGSSYSLDDELAPLAKAGAVTTSFRADDIISDQKMYTGTAMSSAAEVQAFLQAQVPTCRADYTCLKDYRTSTTTMPGDTRCTAYTGSGSAQESAAAIIYKVGKACGVSQKVLLVLIQKESQLVGDDWPVDKQYQQATGFDCSDTAPCNPEYAGFFNQVYWAAWSLKDYKVDAAAADYRVGEPVRVRYSDAEGCDGTILTLRTQATASLYNYTPYQPDEDALAGEEGPCASFGNLNFWIIYTDWFGYPHIDVDRISAPDRYSESVAIAEKAYPDGADTVYLVTGTGYADALSAGPAAVKDHAPLLLTTPDSLPQSIADEFSELDPDDVVIVGGQAAVSAGVESQVRALLPDADVERISGVDRFEVSRKVAQRAFPDGADAAYVATGLNFPDALSASGAGGHNGEPVVLVNGGATSVDPAVADLLTNTLKVKTVKIAGGTASTSAGMQASIASLGISTQRLSGADRFAASLAINKDAYDNADGDNPSDRVFLATGLNFPDALAGSVLAGAQGSPLLVVPGTCVPQDVKLSFAFFDNTKVTLLGGTATLSAGVESLTSC